jgi:hypothetical protein
MKRFVVIMIIIVLAAAAPVVASPVQSDLYLTKDYAIITLSVDALNRAALIAEKGDMNALSEMVNAGEIVIVKAGIKVKVVGRANYPILRIHLIRNGQELDRDLYTGFNMIEQRMQPPGL